MGWGLLRGASLAGGERRSIRSAGCGKPGTTRLKIKQAALRCLVWLRPVLLQPVVPTGVDVTRVELGSSVSRLGQDPGRRSERHTPHSPAKQGAPTGSRRT
ncbi:hypothetical protein H920_10588 [Fukomys damarensis]|uniref:Uncharacterized protein n=1 Tax=Fukomys damarensis TaxID=885580 RepID=A0A091DYZ5_FUKDA|nr:hypothetical protein H920_10588 [Fukomys damarensis]